MTDTAIRFNLSTVFDTVAKTVPEQEAMVWGNRRLRYRDLNARIDGLAHYLARQGLGSHMPREQLAGHQSGQDHLGLYLRNGNEYLEGMIGAYRARVAAFNINYRYVDDELRYLLTDASTRALIYHAEFAPHVAAIRDWLSELDTLIQVADGSGHELLPGAVDYESIVTTAAPAEPMPIPRGDDLYMIYTGGTTGMPKGVLWRHHDVFVAAMGGTPFGSSEPYSSYQEISASASGGNGGLRMLMTAPFMHGAAQWSTFHIINSGGTIVLPDDAARLDWQDVLRTIARERVVTMPIVGDAMARPLLDALEEDEYDLSCLTAISNGGAALTPVVSDRLLAALPHILLLDAVGSSETGIQMNHVSAAGAQARTSVFDQQEDTTVLDELLERELSPGEGQGWLARRGFVPLGYLGDAAKTARTFPVIDGERYSVPGDRATLLDNGQIELLGRDGITINSGGEKIFAEEVERAMTAHPEVRDVIVVGRPSQRWGSEPVAIVALTGAGTASDADLLAECARHIAAYKVPKAILRRAEIVRSPSGKADYRWAKHEAQSDEQAGLQAQS